MPLTRPPRVVGATPPLGFWVWLTLGTPALMSKVIDNPSSTDACSYRYIRTGKVHANEERLTGDILFYTYKNPQILSHPCVQRVALYMGNKFFLTTNSFQSSLLPLTIPKSFKVGVPNVTAAVFSSSHVIMVINGGVYSYDYEERVWSQMLRTKYHFTHIYSEYCCYSTDFSCMSVSNLVLVYSIGKSPFETTIYISKSLGYEFKELDLPQLKSVGGIFEAIFYFHSMSKYGILLKISDKANFVYTEPPLNESWGMSFNMSGEFKIINLPGLKGFMIIWNEDHLMFSHNCGQLMEDISIKSSSKSSFASLGRRIITIANNENEIAILTDDSNIYYGTLGLLSTAITKLTKGVGLKKETSLMFESIGILIVLTPLEDDMFEAYDFKKCSLNIQSMFMDFDVQLRGCKAEILRGDFNKKMFVIDMGDYLKLSAIMVPQPAQTPIPIITVSNPHVLGFQVKMFEDGYTFDGNIKFTINITLMQQHLSGRAHENFISNIKEPSLSTITLDLIDRGMSCVDLEPLVGLISIGCNWAKRIIVRRNMTACSKGILNPVELQANFTYTIKKNTYDPNYHSQIHSNNVDKILDYHYEELGCPLLAYYNSPWKPVIELWEGSKFVEVVETEFVLIEINGVFTYNYSTTVGGASCKSQAQNWSSMLNASSVKDLHVWNRESYVSCHEQNENSPLLWPDVEYQILGGRTDNKIIFDQRNGFYIFFVCIVDPYYSYCDLTTTVSIYVYGAFPKPSLPDYPVVIIILFTMLLSLWLGYIIPKLSKAENENSFKMFFRNLCQKKKPIKKVDFNRSQIFH